MIQELPSNIDTFIGMYNYMKDNNIPSGKVLVPSSGGVCTDIMINAMGVCIGGGRDRDFIRQLDSVDLQKHNMKFRIVRQRTEGEQ